MTAPRRSDPTRAAILDAARHRFERDGFAATTVRTVAADAGADPALVIRYFGSKQGLFDASSAIDLDLQRVDFGGVPTSKVGARVVQEFLARWDGPAGQPLRVLLTAAVTDPDSRERLLSIFTHQVRPAIGAAARDRQEERTRLVATTIIGLAMTRYVVQLPGTGDAPASEIVALFGPVVQRHLVGSLPAVGS